MLHAHGEQEPQCTQYEEQDVDDAIEYEEFGQVAVLWAKKTMRESKMTGTRRYLAVTS